MEITLRHIPSRLQKLMGQKEKTVLYKGFGDDWYSCPCYSPAPTKVNRRLKAISLNPEYRHLQHHIKRCASKVN